MVREIGLEAKGFFDIMNGFRYTFEPVKGYWLALSV
jgi:hypothetical protein